MVGILVEVAVSWLFMWLFYRKDLSVLGLRPTGKRIAYLFAGIVGAGLCSMLYHLMVCYFAANPWMKNSGFSIVQFAEGSWWTLRSVLYEEFIFRGVLLYIGIEMFGNKKAIITSSVAFAIYHWFSFEVFGSVVLMIYTFIATGMAGLVFSYAFAKRRSMYLPVGLHFGWNLTNIVVFSSGPLGKQMLLRLNDNTLTAIPSLLMLMVQIFLLPALVYIFFKKIRPRSQQ